MALDYIAANAPSQTYARINAAIAAINSVVAGQIQLSDAIDTVQDGLGAAINAVQASVGANFVQLSKDLVRVQDGLGADITRVQNLLSVALAALATRTAFLESGINTTAGRPGEDRGAYTSSLAGGPFLDRPALSAPTAFGSEGSVVRFSGSGLITTRRLVAIEAGRVYSSRYAVRRRTNSPDPSNDAVVCGVAWYDQAGNLLAGGSGRAVVRSYLDLTADDGRQAVGAVISSAPGVGIDIVAPPGARFFAPYVELFGISHVTDVEVLTGRDITDATVYAPDVSAFESRLSAQESQDAGSRLAVLESAVTSPKTFLAENRAAIVAANIPVSVTLLRLAGYAAAGDGGRAEYARVAGEPTHPGKIMSKDGAWWAMRGARVYPEALGAKGDGITDDLAALNNATATAAAIGASLRGRPGATYLVSAAWKPAVATNNVGIEVVMLRSTVKLADNSNDNACEVMGGDDWDWRGGTYIATKTRGGTPVRGPNRGLWTPGTPYVTGDLVEVSAANVQTGTVAPSNLVYRCKASHTSGTSYGTDRALYWEASTQPNFDASDKSYRTRNSFYVDGVTNSTFAGIKALDAVYAGINLGTGPVQTYNQGAGITNVTLQRYFVSGCENGVAGGRWADCTICDGKVQLCDIYGIVADIAVINTEIRNNVLVGKAGSSHAIYVYTATQTAANDNLIRGPWANDVVIEGGANVTISNRRGHYFAIGFAVFIRGVVIATVDLGGGAHGCGGGVHAETCTDINLNDIRVNGCLVSSGIEVVNCNGVGLNGGQSNSGAGHGLATVGSTRITATGFQAKNNAADAINLHSTIGATFVACLGTDTRAPGAKTQQYGLRSHDGSDAITRIGCDFAGNRDGVEFLTGTNNRTVTLVAA
jgi:hypothetical protein